LDDDPVRHGRWVPKIWLENRTSLNNIITFLLVPIYLSFSIFYIYIFYLLFLAFRLVW
jgi:hypothetical protein